MITIVGLSLTTASAQSQTAGGAGRGGIHRPSVIRSYSGTEAPPRARLAHARPPSAVAEPTVRRVPGTYPSIQSAIDASYDGDTVFISEGTYYENIRFRGKAIVVASHYLIDGDTAHIERTIIDGSRPANPDSASVVYMVDGEDTTSVLLGLTITGGKGTLVMDVGGPTAGRVGGGICIDGSGARLTRNLITRNRVSGGFGFGGGVSAGFPFALAASPVILEGNRICDNAAWGDSFAGCSGGAEFMQCDFRIVGNTFERDTAGGGQYTQGGAVGVYGWTFQSGSRFPEGEITGNVFRGNVCLETVNAYPSNAIGAGLLLYRTGAVTVSDNLFEANFASTQYGYADGGGVLINDQDTTGYGRKHILRNRFVGNRSYTECARTDITASGGGLELDRTLATVSGNSFTGNIALGRNGADGGGLCIFNSSFIVERNIFAENSSSTFGAATGNGGGMSLGSPPQEGTEQIVTNNVFVGNYSGRAGGAIATWDWPATGVPSAIINNTIIGNRTASEGGGMVAWNEQQNLFVMNNIFRENLARYSPNQISNYSNRARFLHNNIQGGWAGEGNFDAEVRFVGDAYTLSDSSLCIGAGKDSAELGGWWFSAPRADMAGNLRPNPPGSMPDVGATENPLPLPLGATHLRLAPRALDFESVPPGSCSETLFITLVNRGRGAHAIQALSWNRTEFALVPPPTLPVVIPPMDTVRLGVAFRPLVPGLALRDTLSITTSDTLFGRVMVSLSGRGSGPVQCAQPGVLYALSSSPSGARLYALERSTGAAQMVARYTPPLPSSVSAIAVRGRDCMLYGALEDSASTRIYRLSAQMGDSEPDRSIPIPGVVSMAFGPADDLYVVTEGGSLYRLRGAEEPVRLGSTGHSLTGLAFNPSTCALWGTIRDSVFTVDPTTGEAHLVGASGWSAPRSSIAFAPSGGMYALYGSNLVTLGSVWGEPTVIGPTGVGDLVGIAMRCDAASMDADEPPGLPRELRLLQNYPNPFNPTTVIGFDLPAPRDVRLEIFDLLGRLLGVPVDERREAGSYSVKFDGSVFASGVYIYRLRTGSSVLSRRMILMR